MNQHPSTRLAQMAWSQARRMFLVFLGLLVMAPAAFSLDTTVCAIRWDAWYTNGPNDPAHYTASTLSQPKWRPLVPLHGKFDNNGELSWAATQETFDREILAAHTANLCWAFLAYGSNGIDLDHSMMRGLALLRSSRIKLYVKYAVIVTPALLGKKGENSSAIDVIMHLMHDSNYQKLPPNDSRPLLFLFFDTPDLQRVNNDYINYLRETLDTLKTASIKSNIGNPYVVILSAGASKAEYLRANLNADAISQYVAGNRKGRPETWEEFEPSIEADWERYAHATKADVVPTLRSGADIRARCEMPPPYEHRFPPGKPCNNYVENPTLDQLTAEFSRAVSWLDAHRGHASKRLLLVYAWSECDESGNCLMPTYGDPNGRKLRAIAKGLQDSMPPERP